MRRRPEAPLGAVAIAAALLVFGVAVSRGDGDPDLEVAEAKSALAVLDARIKAGAWNDAARAASSACEKHGEDLVAGQGGVFLPARAVVRARLAAIPEEGRDALERLFGDDVRKKLEAARASAEPAALEALGDRFLALDAGAEALVLAGDRWLERGCVAFAVAAWRDVLLLSSSKERRKEAVRRLEGALPLLGSEAACREIAAELEGMEGMTGAAAAIRAVGAAKLPALEDLSVDGSGSIAPVASVAFGRAPRWTATTHSALGPEHDWRDQARRLRALPILTAGSLGLDGVTVVHLGRALAAYDSDKGTVAWRHEDRRSVRFFAGLLRARATSRFGLTHDAGRVFATLQTDSLDTDLPRGRLVAIDARTGKLLWDAIESEWLLGEPGDQDPDKDQRLSYVGTPLASGGKVFCGAQSALSASETWLTASDADTGRLLWKRRLLLSASPPVRAVRGGRAGRDFPLVMRLAAPVLGVVKGALVVASGNGLLAALDPADGRLLWARPYESTEGYASEAADFAREGNPILGVRGLALVLAPDARQMIAVRVHDGSIADTAAREFARLLLGIAGGEVLTMHGQVVQAWGVGRDEKLAATWALSVGEDRSAAIQFVGRGLVTTRGVLLPIKEGVVRVDPRLHERGALIPWPGDRRVAGDLVAAGERVVSIGVLATAGWAE